MQAYCLSNSMSGNKRSFSPSFDSDDDSDNEDDFAAWNRLRNNNKKQATKTSFSTLKTSKAAAMPATVCNPSLLPVGSEHRKLKLSPAEKANVCSIENEQDRGLQVLLWNIGCNYILHEHQFKGVRAIAGVAEDFGGVSGLELDKKATEDALRSVKNTDGRHRGLLVADVMGLGKTVQAVIGCIVRNKIAEVKEEPRMPTLICVPNESILEQWVETLVKAGVLKERIFRFRTKQGAKFEGEIFVLCTRYDLQTEARACFDSLKQEKPYVSPLFPKALRGLLDFMKNQYMANKGKEVDKFRMADVSRNENITHHLKRSEQHVPRVFRTVVIDEAHFLRNLTTFWGMAASLIGLHAHRIVPMTGTPYNNSEQDMATLCSFFQPSHPAACVKWWKLQTQDGAAERVVEGVSSWGEMYLLRRGRDVIADLLPKKSVERESVQAFPIELSEYEKYEAKFLCVMKRLKKLQQERDASPFSQMQFNECLQIMLSVACCMRSALIHPVLSKGGRDLTVFFSPTRSQNKAVIKAQQKKQCVCCNRKTKLALKKDTNYSDFDDDMDSDDHDIDSIFELANQATGEKHMKGTGEIVPIPSCMCFLATKGVRHFACQSCLHSLKANRDPCPRCSDLFDRLRCEPDIKKAKKNLKSAKSTNESLGIRKEQIGLPGRIYCKKLFGGFRASAKLERFMSDFKTKLPEGDKVIIASFFKGSLDLIEAMFAELYPETKVARFDGDIGKLEREHVLQRFKENPSCRVLLATVQSIGVGLNLVEANHVWFLDRFWNPMVMEQCEDRCYRLGQEKDVVARYYDVSMTIDDVMAYINDIKATNAAVILSDGPSIAKGGVSFREVAGKLGEAIGACREARAQHIAADPMHMLAPLPVVSTADIMSIADSVRVKIEASASSMQEAFAAGLSSMSAPQNQSPLSVPSNQSAFQPQDWATREILLQDFLKWLRRPPKLKTSRAQFRKLTSACQCFHALKSLSGQLSALKFYYGETTKKSTSLSCCSRK